MTEPWNLTEPQRRQLREAQAAAKQKRVKAPPEPSCPFCGGPRAERWYVPGVTGQPVSCPSGWHGDGARDPGEHEEGSGDA